MIPFKSLHSLFVGEPEELRQRQWIFVANQVLIKTSQNKNIKEVYESIQVTISELGLKFAKRDYPQHLQVIENFKLGLVIKLKSKLKSLMLQHEPDQLTQSLQDGN